MTKGVDIIIGKDGGFKTREMQTKHSITGTKTLGEGLDTAGMVWAVWAEPFEVRY